VIVRGESDGVVFVAETEWEVEQLKRLDRPGTRFQLERIDRIPGTMSGDRYPRGFLLGDAIKVKIPEHRWGT
jgi:hypothetical protein